MANTRVRPRHFQEVYAVLPHNNTSLLLANLFFVNYLVPVRVVKIVGKGHVAVY